MVNIAYILHFLNHEIQKYIIIPKKITFCPLNSPFLFNLYANCRFVRAKESRQFSSACQQTLADITAVVISTSVT